MVPHAKEMANFVCGQAPLVDDGTENYQRVLYSITKNRAMIPLSPFCTRLTSTEVKTKVLFPVQYNNDSW